MLCQPSPPLPSDSALVAHVRQTSALTLRGSDARISHLVQEPQTFIHDLLLRTSVCSLALWAPHGPDLVLAFHIQHGEIRCLVPTVSTLISVIRIVAAVSSSFQSNLAASWSLRLRRVQPSIFHISVSPTTHSHTCARLSRPI